MDGRPPKRPRLQKDVDLQVALHIGRISMAGLRTKATTSCVQWVLLCDNCMMIERCPASLHQRSNCLQVSPNCSPMFFSVLQVFSSVLQMFSKCLFNVLQMFAQCYPNVFVMKGLCCIPLLVCMWPGEHCSWRTKPGIHSTQTVSASTPLARYCERNAASDRMQLLTCTSQQHLPGRSLRNAAYTLFVGL